MGKLFRRVIWVVFLLCGLVNTSIAQNQITGTVVKVEAGDRVQVQLQGWTVTVRLHGIDCPTTPPALVERAIEYTKRRIGTAPVRVVVQGTGTKQRLFGDVYPEGSAISLNEELLQVGLARWSTQYAAQRLTFRDAEAEARSAGRGLWSDKTGANVPLPELTKPRPTPNTIVSNPTPTPIPKVLTEPIPPLTPQVSQPPATAPVTTQQRVNSPAVPAPPPPTWLYLLPIVAFVAALVFALLQRATGWDPRAIASQLFVSLMVGVATALLVLLPTLLLTQALSFTVPMGIILVSGVLAVVCFRASSTLCRREQALRTTQRTPIGQLRPGFVRVAGETSAPNGLVESSIGNIPAIYIHEISWRCESRSERPLNPNSTRRSLPQEWVRTNDETRIADIHITDDTGTIGLDTTRAAFRPLRVARFYNEVPVEEFFDNPYTGDTRTEIYFIPATANLVVWGRCYPAPSVRTGEPEYRIGYDPILETLVMVEENPARLFTNRLLWGVVLVLLAVLLLGVALYISLNPALSSASDTGTASPIAPGIAAGAFLVGGVLLYGFARIYQVLQKRQKTLQATWNELDNALAQRWEHLQTALPQWEQLPTVREKAELTGVKEALLRIAQTAPHTELLRAEQELSHRIADLLRVLDQLPDSQDAELSDLRIELRTREQFIAEAMENYRVAEYAWNQYHLMFPHGWIIRSLPSPIPIQALTALSL